MNSIQEVKLETVKDDKKENPADLPIYLEQIKDLKDEEKLTIIDDIIAEHKEIDDEWQEKNIVAELKALDNQYDGKMEEDDRRMFNLSVRVTKTKVDRVKNMIKQALMKSDPKYSVSPRPGFEKQGGQDVCDKQSDFLDFKLDNLPFEVPIGQAIHNSVLKRIGIVRWEHVIKREPRKRDEKYKGNPQPIIDPKTKQVIGIKNEGLEEFLRNWPDAAQDYPNYIKALSEGKEINFVATFTETTYDDPMPISIEPKNIRVRLDCDGYEGLKTTKLIVEYESYSYWELKRKEKQGFFFDVDELTYKDKPEAGKDRKRLERFKNETYEIWRCTFYTKLKETDKEEMKCIFWISEEKKKMIGAIRWPHYGIDSEYVPHYISKNKRGFFGENLADTLTDSQFAKSAILNHLLEAMWMRVLITPITNKNSSTHQQFINKSWTNGVPIEKDKDEKLDFLQKYMGPVDIGGTMALLQYLNQEDDNSTGVSAGISGREAPLDPSAPAAKTLALLKMSGIDIEAYIISISPSFNINGEILLQLYYQIAQDGVSYRLSPDRAKPDSPFSILTRSEMIAKTNIQVQAKNFDFEKNTEKQEDVALFSLLRQEPLIAANPQAVWFILKNIIKNWSPKWQNLVERILPPIEQLQKEQAQLVMKSVMAYIQAKVQESKVTGAPPEFDLKQLMPMVANTQKLLATPPSKEEAANMEKQGAPA